MRQGISYNLIRPEEFGVNFVGTVYFTTKDIVKEKPQLVQSFVNALIGGWDRASKDQKKAIQYLKQFDGNIDVVSLCSHHNLAFTGKAHVAYIPKAGEKVIGLSKLNRVVDWYARRPQIQEGLTMQIHKELDEMIDNEGIAVFIDCQHQCCSNRGIGHKSTMQTAQFSGHFFDNKVGTKDEFYQMINNLKK